MKFNIANRHKTFKKKFDKKKEQESHIHEKAAMLRKYAKLCKSEGISSDRVNLNNNSKGGENKEKPSNNNDNINKKDFNLLKKVHKVDPLIEKEKNERETNIKQRNEALKKRSDKRKQRIKLTKKGQPKLGFQIKSILSTLQC
jgi:hypothetical protein